MSEKGGIAPLSIFEKVWDFETDAMPCGSGLTIQGSGRQAATMHVTPKDQTQTSTPTPTPTPGRGSAMRDAGGRRASGRPIALR